MNKEHAALQEKGSQEKKRPSRLLEIAQRFFDSRYFGVDAQRAYEFLYLQDRSETKSSAQLHIPLGKRDSMEYSGQILGGVSDRPISSYQERLFPDVFAKPVHNPGTFTVEKFLREANRLETPAAEFGGYEEVFKPGNVVLDIATGEAVAAMQLALNFPETTIIGTDILYKEERTIYPRKRGLQLTHADWHVLEAIPDKSVDAILSMQGIAMWGLPKSARDVTNENGFKIIQTINRISKPGTILRLDIKNEFLAQNLGDNWEISPRDDVFLARKK